MDREESDFMNSLNGEQLEFYCRMRSEKYREGQLSGYKYALNGVFKRFAENDSGEAFIAALDMLGDLTAGNIGDFDDYGEFTQTAMSDKELCELITETAKRAKEILKDRMYGMIGGAEE